MGVDDAVWARVRRAHDEGDEPAVQFCRRLGVSVSTYYRRRKRENWQPRPRTSRDLASSPGSRNKQDAHLGDTGSVPLGDDDGSFGAVSKRISMHKRTPQTLLVKRLYNAINQELKQLESGQFGARLARVGEVEQRTRTLMNMIRGFEKVLELDTDKGRSKRDRGTGGTLSSADGPGRSSADTSAEDAERMRRQIAERLERLQEQWSDSNGTQRAQPKRD